MDLFEKINRSFGSWYEGLFGGSDDVRPKDILRRIFVAMEDHRKEGFDNRVYVPNQYVLEINVHDEEEKQYLLSFLDRDELEAAVRRYCQQNHYHIRGALDFTINEVDALEVEDAPGKRSEKVRIRCRYDSKITIPEQAAAAGNAHTILPAIPIEERTMPAVDLRRGMEYGNEEEGTVPSITAAALIVYGTDRPPYRFAIARGSVMIGRSKHSGNQLVIETDGQISKQHARLELDADGQFTIYDLGSTNGTKVNGRRVDNRTLHDGDEITLGTTRITFQQTEPDRWAVNDNGRLGGSGERTTAASGAFGGAAALRDADGMGSSTPPSRILRTRTARLVLMDQNQDVDEFLLASETLLGRAVTNDIVLPDRTIATRHARILNEGNAHTLEALTDTAETRLNGATLAPREPIPLKNGDKLSLGSLVLRYDSGA